MIVLLTSFVLVSCHSVELTEQDVLKMGVEEYLPKVDVPDEISSVYISPCISCKGCEQKMMDEFLKRQSKENCLLILCHKEYLKRLKYQEVNRFLIDTTFLVNYQFSMGLPLRIRLSPAGEVQEIKRYEAL